MSQFPAPVIGRWMSTGLLTIGPKASLDEASETMREERIRHLLVTDEDGKLLGILSSRDAQKGKGKVESVMTKRKDLKTADTHEPVKAAAETMCREKISALPVLQGEKLVGIVTSEDLLWALLQEETHQD